MWSVHRPEIRKHGSAAATVGAKPIDWPANRMLRRFFSVTAPSWCAVGWPHRCDATRGNAAAIVVACPMCQSNLDMRRPEIERRLQQNTDSGAVRHPGLLGDGHQAHRWACSGIWSGRITEPELEVVGDDDDEDDD